MTDLLTYLLPVVVAAITQPLFEALQRAVTLLDAIPKALKPVVVALLTYGGTKLGVWLGVTLSIVDPTQWTAQDVGALAAAGLAMVLHLGVKKPAQP